MPNDMSKQTFKDDSTAKSIRDAINGEKTSKEELDDLLAEAEEMGKKLTKVTMKTSVV